MVEPAVARSLKIPAAQEPPLTTDFAQVDAALVRNKASHVKDVIPGSSEKTAIQLKSNKTGTRPPDPQNQCCRLKQVSRTLHKKQPLWFPSFTATFFNIDVGGAGASDTC